jgi:hypothetical protein
MECGNTFAAINIYGHLAKFGFIFSINHTAINEITMAGHKNLVALFAFERGAIEFKLK